VSAKRAIKILSNVTKAFPSLGRAHFNLATVYANTKMFREAADEYKATLDLEPRNDLARLSLVKAYESAANYEDALPYAEDYAKRNPQSAEGQYLLGSAYRSLGRYSEAETFLQRAVAIDPSDYGSRYDLGFVLAHEGKPEKALPHCRKPWSFGQAPPKLDFSLPMC
jgi:tetratricopeptide (TPR) repeat protein